MSIVDLTLNARRVVATVALAIAGLDAGALVFGSMAGMAMSLVLALHFAPVPFPRWRSKGDAGPAALWRAGGARDGRLDRVPQRGLRDHRATLGPAQVGFYWRAYQLAVEYQRKISVAMAQMAFPVLARTAGASELLALRQRMVRLLTVVVFPLLDAPGPARPGRRPVAVRPGVGAGGGADADPRPRRGGDAGHGRLRLGLDGRRAGPRAPRLRRRPPGRLRRSRGRARAPRLDRGGDHRVRRAHGLPRRRLFRPARRPGPQPPASPVAGHRARDHVLRGAGQPRPARSPWGCRASTPHRSCRSAPSGLAGALGYLGALRLWFPSSAHDLGAAIGRVLPGRLALPRLRGPALAKP